MRARLQEATRTGRPFGDQHFIERYERESGLILRRQRPGRKPAFNAATVEDCMQYDVA